MRVGPYDGWRPKLVATDLDGTLLRPDATLSDRNRATVHRLRERGVAVVPVTGRGPRLLPQTREELAEDGLIVLGQGGCVMDGDTVIASAEFTVDQAMRVVERMRDVHPSVLVGLEDAADHGRPLRLQHGFDWPYHVDEYEHVDAHEVVTSAAYKVFFRADDLGADALLMLAQQVLPADLAEATHSGIGAVEISPPGVTKAAGLAIAAQRLGVEAADTICFGDMPNDLPMFAWCAWAVAMGNAHPLVADAADDHAPPNDQDGLSAYLEERFGW